MRLPGSGRLRGREEEQVAECILSDLYTLQEYFLLPLTGHGELEEKEFKSLDFFFHCLECKWKKGLFMAAF